jgi:hypothetical protein
MSEIQGGGKREGNLRLCLGAWMFSFNFKFKNI